MAARKRSSPARRSIAARTRIAYHEAGHAVLSAAIADRPRHVSIRPEGLTLGRSGARMSARPTSRVQVHLAGFAAEHIITGRRSRQLAQEVGFALLSCLDPKLSEAFAGTEHHDGHRAVQEVLKMGTLGTDDEIRGEVDRFYEIARESLSSVWPAVAALAKALIKHEELDREGVDAALDGIDIFTSILGVQRAHGLMLATEAHGTHPAVPGGLSHEDINETVEVLQVLKKWRDERDASEKTRRRHGSSS